MARGRGGDIGWDDVRVSFGDSNQALGAAIGGMSQAGTVFGQLRKSILDEEQRAVDNAFREKEMVEKTRQFEATQGLAERKFGLEGKKFGEEKRATGVKEALDQAKFEENTRQFGITSSETIRHNKANEELQKLSIEARNASTREQRSANEGALIRNLTDQARTLHPNRPDLQAAYVKENANSFGIKLPDTYNPLSGYNDVYAKDQANLMKFQTDLASNVSSFMKNIDPVQQRKVEGMVAGVSSSKTFADVPADKRPVIEGILVQAAMNIPDFIETGGLLTGSASRSQYNPTSAAFNPFDTKFEKGLESLRKINLDTVNFDTMSPYQKEVVRLMNEAGIAPKNLENAITKNTNESRIKTEKERSAQLAEQNAPSTNFIDNKLNEIDKRVLSGKSGVDNAKVDTSKITKQDLEKLNITKDDIMKEAEIQALSDNVAINLNPWNVLGPNWLSRIQGKMNVSAKDAKIVDKALANVVRNKMMQLRFEDADIRTKTIRDASQSALENRLKSLGID